LNESTLRRQERGGIDYGSRPHFVRLVSFGRFGSRSSRSTRFATTTRISGFAATTRISGFATASGLSTATTTLLFAAAATEDAIEQGDAATLLYDALGGAAVASRFATTGGLSATAGVLGFATTSGLGATAGIRTTGVTRLLSAVMTTEQVQQRATALLGRTTTGVIASIVASGFSAASRLSATSGICTTGIATAVAAVLLAFVAATQQVQQRCLAAFRLAGHALHIASSITAAAGAWIRTRCVTTAGLVAAAVVVCSEHSVEQIHPEALGAEAEAEHQRSD
jgi:hypothetical protein